MSLKRAGRELMSAAGLNQLKKTFSLERCVAAKDANDVVPLFYGDIQLLQQETLLLLLPLC